MNSRFRVGIDVGGTFTDLVAFDEESGESFLIKLPSTPHDPSEGVIQAFKHLRERSEREISVFVHASTVGSNLFLGQLGLNIPKGAQVTAGMPVVIGEWGCDAAERQRWKSWKQKPLTIKRGEATG
jgi:N-methylhydantoinase A